MNLWVLLTEAGRGMWTAISSRIWSFPKTQEMHNPQEMHNGR